MVEFYQDFIEEEVFLQEGRFGIQVLYKGFPQVVPFVRAVEGNEIKLSQGSRALAVSDSRCHLRRRAVTHDCWAYNSGQSDERLVGGTGDERRVLKLAWIGRQVSGGQTPSWCY